MRSVGFTLIELLVVISIIAVLASMLLPAVGMVRASARGVQCSSILRQLGMGMMQYTSDNEGSYPTVCAWDGAKSWDANVMFREFLENTAPGGAWPKNMLCPNSLGYKTYTGSIMRSYGMNEDTLLPTHATAPCTYVSANVRRAADKILLADALDWWLTGWGARHYVAEMDITGLTMLTAYRHGGGANMVFFDGHVERRARASVDTLINSGAFNVNWQVTAP
jgi:prepilin-type processing-associated H-X9-DG protein/prepilin-type N-terminal cleavage/methylation domain-containing protein